MDKINKNFFESYDSFEISLGELLRGERATLGKSCSDVQKDLKIKAVYIKAIESCERDFGELKSTLKGNTSLMFSEVSNAPAKLIKNFRKKLK